jgi:hypothetical protein
LRKKYGISKQVRISRTFLQKGLDSMLHRINGFDGRWDGIRSIPCSGNKRNEDPNNNEIHASLDEPIVYDIGGLAFAP